MGRDRRTALAALVLALVVVLEFVPALSLRFAGDDFELISLARIGGFAPRALVLPHRGAFVKPVLNAVWAAGAALFGTNEGAWYTLALLVHLLCAILLGLFARRLATAWTARGGTPASGIAPPTGASPQGFAHDVGPHPRSPRGLPGTAWLPGPQALTGLLAALVWAVHDRLSEPVFSIASLNHSITFVLYLAALLAGLRALTTGGARARLLTALFVLLTLFSYEVGASVLFALVLLALLVPDAPGAHGGPDGAEAPGPQARSGAGAAAPVRGARRRIAALGLPVGAAALAWAAVQGVSRLSPGAVSYYAFSPSLMLGNLAEIGLGFLHVPSYRIAPNALIALPFAALLLAGALLPRLDRIVRFGCAWALAASLPVLPIPFFSDRYHYIVFAGLAIAAGRIVSLLLRGETRRWMRTHEDMTAAGSKAPAVSPSPANAMPTTIVTAPAATMAPVPPAADAASHPARGRLALASLAIAAALAHVIWSVAGAREQAAYYAFKGVVPSRLLEEARAYEDAAAHPGRRARGPGPAILAIVWRGDAVHLGQVFQEAEARVLKPRFSDTHPFYVRPQGVLGAVYPLDLFNLAAEERGGFYRRPAPAGAARALAKGNVRVVPVGLFYWGKDAPAGLSAHVAGRLRDALLARREIPQSLPGEEGPSAPEWKVAWIEATDRAGAFETEYGPEPEPGPAPAASRVPVDPSPPQAGSTPGSRR